MKLSAFNLDKRRGEVTLLNFWATWCAPCRAEIPDLIELQEAMRDEGLQIIGIATDMQGGKVVRPFAGKLPINYPIVIDAEGQLSKKFGGVRGLPTTFVIGPDGKVVNRVLGMFPIKKMKPQLKEMLASG